MLQVRLRERWVSDPMQYDEIIGRAMSRARDAIMHAHGMNHHDGCGESQEERQLHVQANRWIAL